MKGPLTGVRVLEMEAIGPVPWAGMMLANMGAEVTRVERPQPMQIGIQGDARFELVRHGKQVLKADLKTDLGREAVLTQIAQTDILLEGFRPGVMERLGLSPSVCQERNPALVFGRMTGWGQYGPLANAVGHDINYIALSGALHAIGEPGKPPAVPLNLIGDFGAGGMLLIVGVLAALTDARVCGKGRVVDAAMVDGTLALMTPIFGRWQSGQWSDARESNWLDGGAHFYTTYQTADDNAVAVGAIEPQFYSALLKGLNLRPEDLPPQHDRSTWPDMKARFASIFATRDRDDWARHFESTDACVTPVLALSELQSHPHLQARRSFLKARDVVTPAPAPRFL